MCGITCHLCMGKVMMASVNDNIINNSNSESLADQNVLKGSTISVILLLMKLSFSPHRCKQRLKQNDKLNYLTPNTAKFCAIEYSRHRCTSTEAWIFFE